MSLTDALKKGMVIRHEERLYRVDDFHVAQAGQQKPRVHVKLRSLSDGHARERLLDQMGRIEEVQSVVRPVQYLYHAGHEHVFMDSDTFEQYPLTDEMVADVRDFLVENETYRLLTVEELPVEIQLPTHVALEVTETAAAEHGAGGGSVYKEAKLASGLSVQVPLFIKTGEKVRVDTASRAYLGKEH